MTTILHGHATSKRPSPTYRSWKSMICRCLYESSPNFNEYGGRGIVVCDRWLKSFSAFLADMGERPSRTTIDRINNAGNYEPGNCRWATRAEQSRNTSRNITICAFGQTMCLEDWAVRRGINAETLRGRLRRGMSAEAALSEPIRWRPSGKLSETDVRQILASAETGVALARRFSVSPSSISLIRKGSTWKELR